MAFNRPFICTAVPYNVPSLTRVNVEHRNNCNTSQLFYIKYPLSSFHIIVSNESQMLIIVIIPLHRSETNRLCVS